ncbi:MAG TPA: preprotein translocase subunit SecY [Flavobacteriales bacterium]|nr:preprotein translocase subunit SecY [Flavobacteriales bacterium]HRE73214.1 preprotein translocase subunit SecY [Flavobacteriales bacterium]HRJ35312.1 preprotein translocase subunit SecY [Flavobacteriales bacterium]HRJ38457.1 preprotein translocase subunit SecY [Flavobacteriales bacterium]
MKDLVKTLKNIWKIEELRQRIVLTFTLILIYRVGSYVVLPGVNSAGLNQGGPSGLAGLLDLFAGGAFSRASIFALGIMPYISASIIMQLLGIAVPSIQKMQREGESGRKKLNQWTRVLTIFITAFQAPGYIATSVPAAAQTESFSYPLTIMILIAGTMFIMWLGERITDKGIGNGISLLIMIGIIAKLPGAFAQELVSRHTSGGYVVLLVEVVLLLLVIAFSILLVQGTRRIPVQFAKRIVGNKQYGGVRNYIPLKVNSAGVMPIIFAQAIMFIPMYINQATEGRWFSGLVNFEGFWYNFIFAIMIILFTYFYTAIMVNPRQMAEEMKRNGGFIPGVKPGKQTESFIDSLISRITLPGAIFLALVAILPAFAMMIGIKQQFAYFYGGTSLLIMVGVVLDTLQQIETHLLSRHYDGLMKSGKIKGRGQQMPSMVS